MTNKNKKISGYTTKMGMFCERRLMVVHLPREYIVGMLASGPTLYLPVIDEMPPDAEVVSVEYSPKNRSWLVTIFHESFPVVPPDMDIPRNDPMKTRTVKILR